MKVQSQIKYLVIGLAEKAEYGKALIQQVWHYLVIADQQNI